MRKFDTVYWDMDGLLSDLTAGLKQFALKNDPGFKGTFKPWEFNSVKDHDYREWLRLYSLENGFSTTPRMPWLLDIEKLALGVKKKGAKQAVLTSRGDFWVDSPRLAAKVNAQKAVWLSEYSQVFSEFQFICVDSSRTKKMFATPSSVLIDDYQRNCLEFTLAGGLGIYLSQDCLGSYENVRDFLMSDVVGTL